MPVIAIATTKGGSGKTTLSAGLAAYFAASGLRVVALDTDANRSLSARLADATFPHKAVEEEAILAAVREAKADANIVIIDVAGAMLRGLLYAISAADVVLIPCKADRTDVIEAARTQDVLRQAEEMTGRTIPHAAVMTQINPRAKATTVTREQLNALGVPRLDAVLPHRTAYQDASWSGVPLAEKAVQEDVAALAAAVLALMESANG